MTNIERINELVGGKEFVKAKELILPEIEAQPNNVELLKLAGLISVNLEEWDRARVYFETAVKYKPDDASSWFYLGSCFDKTGDYISAKNAYINVIKLRKEYLNAYKNLCIVLIKLNKFEEALKYAFSASVIDPSDYLFDFVIGTAYMKVKNFDKGIEFFNKALVKSPDNADVYNSLGTAYTASGNIGEAVKCYQKSIEISPNNSMTYYNLGSALQIQKKHKEAAEHLRKAVELDGEDETFQAALAMSLVKTESFQEALNLYKSLAAQHPEKESYKYNLVTCYEALGDIQTAVSLLESIVYMNKKFILPAQKLANLYIQTNQPAKAKEIFETILLKNKADAETIHQYAVLSSSLCDTGTAEKMLKKVIRMKPDFAKAHKDLGIIYLNKRLFDYAEDEFKIALELQPNDFETVFEYGNFLYATSKNTEAERFYGEALEIEPENVLALTFMALNKLVLNQLDPAREYIMKALKINHHHEYIQFCAGRILYARKEYEEAKNHLIRAAEQNPDVETQNTLALTYYELGEYESAANIFKNLLDKKPDSIPVLMSMAKCCAKLKDNDEALKYLDKLVSIFPEDEEAHELIRKLS